MQDEVRLCELLCFSFTLPPSSFILTFMRPVVIVMVKAPYAGTVKTRLSPSLSNADAASLAACFAKDAVADARCAAQSVIIAYAPTDGRRALEELLPHDDLLLHERRGEDVGARMTNADRAAASSGYSPVIIIGTDSPTLPRSFIETAILSLATNESDIALAPTDDGGYCLIGFRQYSNHLFQNIQWSTPLAYQQTADNAARLKLRLLTLPRWYDVDTFSDLLRLRDEVMTNEASQARAPATFKWLLDYDALLSE